MIGRTPSKPKQNSSYLTPSTKVKDSFVPFSVKTNDTVLASPEHIHASLELVPASPVHGRDSTLDHSKLWHEEGELTLFEGFGTRKSASYEDSKETDLGPKLVWCAYCKGERSTQATYEVTRKTFWSSLGIFLAGGVCGCFLMPYYLDACKQRIEVCHKCRRPL
jgi:hypothetical protein